MNSLRRLSWFAALGVFALGCATDQPASNAGTSPAQPTADGGQAPDSPLAVGQSAPDFKLAANDGKEYTIQSLTERGPVFLYFVKLTCGSNPAAVPNFNKLAKEYGDKVKFVAVVNAPADQVANWRKEYNASFMALNDPDQKVTKSFGLKRSQHTFLIDKDKKVVKSFEGWGQDVLNPLNQAMAEQAKVSVAKLDLTNAPDSRAYG